jgi:4-hydroxy-3-polyprenylbenzoate decarboxylase
MLADRRFGYAWKNGHLISADADFVIVGTIRKGEKKPEGPFGDHLGYYSLQHDFPVMDVEAVYHRKDPLWHFTVVGRPPQEDSSFGYLIHKIVKDLTPQEFPGIRQINAVDEAGVHPLLLAVGSERYMPFREKVPEEILIQANRILGSGQTSLAKYCLIAADEDDPDLDADDQPAFFTHLLERFDPTRDLHFQTRTTIDTLDYSGSGWNAGSKLIWACRGDKRRELGTEVPTDLELPAGFSDPTVVHPGILAIKAPAFTKETGYAQVTQFTQAFSTPAGEEAKRPSGTGGSKSVLANQKSPIAYPLIILCDDPAFLAADFSNFVWATFTRSNPSHDVHGIDSFVEHKHWGCRGPVVIDARVKPWHAPGLVPDGEVERRVAGMQLTD